QKNQQPGGGELQTADFLQAGGGQVVQNPQAKEKIGEVVAKRQLFQVALKKQRVRCLGQVFARHENRVGEIDQDDLFAKILHEIAPTTHPAAQVAHPGLR